jgi:hypothetical protein
MRMEGEEEKMDCWSHYSGDERWKQVLSDTSCVAAVSKKLKAGS